MENTWPWLLGTVLAGAVAYFVGLGLAQSRRARRLVRQALDLGFRFEKEDSLDLPGRLGDFVFFGIGHSPRVRNVTTGTVGGWPFRTFDFHCEGGHGPAREARSYVVAAFETGRDIGQFLLWSEEDAGSPPVAARAGARMRECWSGLGGGPLADALAADLDDFGRGGGSIEARRQVLVLACPLRQGGVSLAVVEHAAGVLGRLFEAPAAEGGEDPPAPAL